MHDQSALAFTDLNPVFVGNRHDPDVPTQQQFGCQVSMRNPQIRICIIRWLRVSLNWAASHSAIVAATVVPPVGSMTRLSKGGSMKQYLGLGLALLAGTAIGAAGVSVLHAQAKPPVYLVTEIDVTNP